MPVPLCACCFHSTFPLFVGYRLSEAGCAIRTFSWQVDTRAESDLAELSFDERVVLANKVLQLAQAHDCIVTDGRHEGLGLHYYSEVSHLLKDGKLPAEIATESPDMPMNQQRYEKYRLLASAAKGLALLACISICMIVSICAEAYQADPYFTEPKPWGENKRYAFLAIEDAIRVLFPCYEGTVGWKPSDPRKAQQKSKKRSATPEARDVRPQAAEKPKKARKPPTCKACGQLRKGHVCTAK